MECWARAPSEVFISWNYAAGRLQLPKDKPIVFQCRTGARSAVACSIAQANGVKNVINLDGGIAQWDLAGYPIVVDAAKPVS